MTQTEIIAITAAAILGIYSLILSYSYFKLKAALQDQQNLSKMWQKSSESAFMMAQKQRSRENSAKETAQTAPATNAVQAGTFSLPQRREAGLVAASL